jgi:hypothetical protein
MLSESDLQRKSARKGKGVAFMENVAKRHHEVPSDDEFSRVMGELEALDPFFSTKPRRDLSLSFVANH